jgi:hypothetical protein
VHEHHRHHGLRTRDERRTAWPAPLRLVRCPTPSLRVGGSPAIGVPRTANAASGPPARGAVTRPVNLLLSNRCSSNMGVWGRMAWPTRSAA